jgi:synaptobrevin family protein YKT6
MTHFALTVAERTKPGQRQDVEVQGSTFHAYGRSEGICGIIISDQEYPKLVAHQLLSKVVDEFLSAYPRSAWSTGEPHLAMAVLKEYINKYQDPQQADSILKIQKELDETKIVLHKTIEKVLERGEKIDDLVAKSDGLSAQSKMFYRMCSAPSLFFFLLGVFLHISLTARYRTSKEAELMLSCDVNMYSKRRLIWISDLPSHARTRVWLLDMTVFSYLEMGCGCG